MPSAKNDILLLVVFEEKSGTNVVDDNSCNGFAPFLLMKLDSKTFILIVSGMQTCFCQSCVRARV